MNLQRKKQLMRLRGMIVKEGYQIIRDPSNILIAFILPLLLLVIYSFGISLDYKGMKIGIVLADETESTASLLSSFEYSRFFSPTVGKNIEEFVPKLIDGTVKGIVVVPSYFSQDRERPDRFGPIQLITDGSDPNMASFVRNYVSAALANWQAHESATDEHARTLVVKGAPRFWYNEELTSRYFLLPGSIALIMTLIGTMLTALVIAREWERGTMEALMSTPISMGEIILSKLIPYYFLGIGSLLFCLFFSVVLIDVPLRGSFLAIFIASSVFLLAALGAGLLISSISRNQFIAYQAAIITGFLPAFMLSGFVFEISSMPKPIQLITWLIPARYFVTLMQTLFLVGNVWPLFFWNTLPLLVIAAILFFITKKQARKRLD